MNGMHQNTSETTPANNGEPDLAQSDSESDEVQVLEKWPALVRAIVTGSREAFQSSPPFEPEEPSKFQQYWCDVFNRLQDDVLSDADIPDMLTSPPVKEFDINLFFQPKKRACPCCLPEFEPSSIVVRNEAGVTKADIIKSLADYLYGDSLPWIHGQNSSTVQSEAIICGSNWMSGGKDKETGLKIAFLKNPSDGPSKPEMWLYCQKWEDFKQNLHASDTETKG